MERIWRRKGEGKEEGSRDEGSFRERERDVSRLREGEASEGLQ